MSVQRVLPHSEEIIRSPSSDVPQQFQPSDRGMAVLREHDDVLDLIRKREADAAKHAIWRHIEAARMRLRTHISSLQQELAPLRPKAKVGG